jgi:hypothetical protein
MKLKLHGVTPQQWAAIAADVLDAEADMILSSPAEALAQGLTWSTEAITKATSIGSTMKTRAALIRGSEGGVQ